MCNICFKASSRLSARQIFSVCDGGLFYRSHTAGTARRPSTKPAHFHLHFSLTAIPFTVENAETAARRQSVCSPVDEREHMSDCLLQCVCVHLCECECSGASDCVSNWRSQGSCGIPVGPEHNYIVLSEGSQENQTCRHDLFFFYAAEHLDQGHYASLFAQ